MRQPSLHAQTGTRGSYPVEMFFVTIPLVEPYLGYNTYYSAVLFLVEANTTDRRRCLAIVL